MIRFPLSACKRVIIVLIVAFYYWKSHASGSLRSMLEAKAPLSIDNFDACDYIFLNHAHPDHYLNIKEFVDKFHPPISVDSLYAAELSRTIGIELAYIFPVDRTQLPLPGLPPRCLLREPQRADRDRLRQLYLHGKAVWHQGHGGAGSIRQPVQHEFHVDPAQWLQGRLCRRNRQSEPSGGVAEQSAKSPAAPAYGVHKAGGLCPRSDRSGRADGDCGGVRCLCKKAGAMLPPFQNCLSLFLPLIRF